MYCLASEGRTYVNGVRCAGKQLDVLGNSSVGFHLFRHPDVLIEMQRVYSDAPTVEILQCKVRDPMRVRFDFVIGCVVAQEFMRF